MDYREYVEWQEVDQVGASLWAGQNTLNLMMLWMVDEYGDKMALKLYAKIAGWDKPFVEFSRILLQTRDFTTNPEQGDLVPDAIREMILAGEPTA